MRQILHAFIPLIAILLLHSTALAGVAPPGTFQDGETGPVYATQGDNGNNLIKLKLTTAGKDELEIVSVWHYDPWTMEWDEITINCTIPGGFKDDPTITLPAPAQKGEKFKVVVTAKNVDGTATISVTTSFHQ